MYREGGGGSTCLEIFLKNIFLLLPSAKTYYLVLCGLKNAFVTRENHV